MQFGVAEGDLLGQPRCFGGVFLRLVEQILNGVSDPVRECGIGVETRQFSVQIHA